MTERTRWAFDATMNANAASESATICVSWQVEIHRGDGVYVYFAMTKDLWLTWTFLKLNEPWMSKL